LEKQIVVTDVTRMSGNRVCIAGVTSEGQTIRPLFPNHEVINEDWLYKNGKAEIFPFSKIILDLLKHEPKPPHTEDWIVNPGVKKFLGLASENERKRILNLTLAESVFAAFGAPIQNDRGFFINVNEGSSSLKTIKAKSVDYVKYDDCSGGKQYKLKFTDQNDEQYLFPVTDLSFRYYLDYLSLKNNWGSGKIGLSIQNHLNKSTVYLRIGLGRPWHPEHAHRKDRHYLQINGVYSFPDYLNNKCFADYYIEPKIEEEIPF